MSVHEPRAPYNYNITVKSACRKKIELKKKKLLCEYFAINLHRVFEPWIFPRQLSFIVIIIIIITTIIHHYVSTEDYGGQGIPLMLSIVFDVSLNIRTWRQ